jgi:predicted amidohydrolase
MSASAPHAFKAACIQLRSGRDVAANVAAALSLIDEAADAGAEFVATPETTSLMEVKRDLLFEKTTDEAHDAALAAFRRVAAQRKLWLLAGSLSIKLSAEKIANRSFLIAPDGSVAARYDKIHMFDVDLGGGETYRESKNYAPGADAVIADLPWGRLGMSVCYDLRFPHLYRSLAQAGASFLSVPSAFTRPTGAAHWHVLLRARAIENGAFVFAPAQGGLHENGRETYGHSLIIAPWGEVLAEAEGDAPGFIIADIELAQVEAARHRVPSLQHDRAFAAPFIKEPVS